MPKDLAREQKDRAANCREDSASDQQPTQDVDVHVHVVFCSSWCWNGWRRRCRDGSYLLPALTAESRMLFNFASALCAKHILQPLFSKRIDPFRVPIVTCGPSCPISPWIIRSRFDRSTCSPSKSESTSP